MTRIIQLIKLLLLTWYSKTKLIWNRIWTIFQTQETPPLPLETTYISSQKYRSIFSTVTTTGEDFLVPEQVWNKIQSALPQSYKLPNSNICKLLDSMSSDSYNYLFPNPVPSPHLFVDPVIWNRITHSLPQSYILPNPVFDILSKPMNGTYYDRLFAPRLETNKKLFVDHTVWEPIKNNLPSQYLLPNPDSNVLFENMLRNSNHTLSTKEGSDTKLSEERIKEKIFNSLPKNYKIPDINLTSFPNINNS